LIDLTAKAGTLSRWAASQSLTRQLAARWARELAEKSAPGADLEFPSVVAQRYGASESMMKTARMLLMGLGLVRQRGAHYCVVQPGAD
jgi:hypothetical protein